MNQRAKVIIGVVLLAVTIVAVWFYYSPYSSFLHKGMVYVPNLGWVSDPDGIYAAHGNSGYYSVDSNGNINGWKESDEKLAAIWGAELTPPSPLKVSESINWN